MALLQGLQEAKHRPQNLSVYWMLLDSLNMYAIYRTHYLNGPALPFLFPHIHLHRHAKENTEKGKILSELFQFVAYQGRSRNIMGSFDTDSEEATRAKINEQPRISDILSAWTNAVFTQLKTFLVATRRYCSSCLRSPKEPDQDIENRIQVLHSTQIPYSTEVHFFVNSNTLCRVMREQRIVGVGSGFEFDIEETFVQWKLQREREQEQQKQNLCREASRDDAKGLL